MSRLGEELGALLAALEAAGIRTALGGKLTAPAVLVEPGDPWSEPNTGRAIVGRTSRWRLTAIAGAVDTRAGLEELADLVERVDGALRLDGVSAATWARPTTIPLGDGVIRPATIGTIQVRASQ